MKTPFALRQKTRRKIRKISESVLCGILFVGMFFTGPVTPLTAADGVWILDAAGNWTGTPANWQGGVIPNGAGDVATFRNDITAARTVTLNAPITLGGMKIGDLLGGSVFTFAGTNALTLNNGVLNAFINKYGNGTDVISAPLTLASNTDFNIFAGTMDITGVLSGPGDVIKNQAGALRVNNSSTFNGDWIVNFGTLNIGGTNGATPASLGTGTGGILLNGHGRQDLAIFSLNNNGAATDGTITYSGNNDVTVQGGATINVDRNYASGANDRLNHILDNLTVNGGILRVTSANGHRLTFAGTTMLLGQTNVIEPLASNTATLANLTLAGVIDDGAATSNLIKEGAGRLAITNTANTFGGITAIKNGVLQLGAGANLGAGMTYINGGVLSVPDAATLNGVVNAGGIALVGQLGISRYSLPAIAYSGSTAIDGGNPFGAGLTVPVAGLVLAIDGVTTTTSTNSANINMANVAGGSNRVWLGNTVGFDRTYTGTLTNGTSGDLRLLAAANSLILNTANQLGGAGATNNLVFGLSHADPIVTVGSHIGQGTALLSGTTAGSGVVSVRANNANTLGSVLVNRGQIVEINGTGLTTPLGAGAVTVVGGTLRSDATSTAQFGNTDFKLYAGGTLLLDNSGVAAANADRRLLNTSNIDLATSTLRLIGDGGAAGNNSSQTVASIDYNGGSTISIDRDAATGSVTTLTTGTLNRVNRGTLNLRSISAQTTTFGTASGTQKLIITTAPTVTNGMIGANIALWGGTASNDGTTPLFATYDGTNGVQAAAFNFTNTLTGAGTGSIVTYDNTAYSGAGASIQALRIRTTANTSNFNASSAMTIGSTAGTGQGAGLFLIHTADNAVAHSTAFNFGSQEALIYASTTGGSSVINLTGVLTGTNGLTKFGDGVLQLSGANVLTGNVTLNAGELRLNNIAAAGGSATAPGQIDLYGGTLYLTAGNSRYYTNVTVSENARFGNVNAGSTAINNLTIAARANSTTPVLLDVRNQAGGNITTAYGTLDMSGNGILAISHPLQVNGGITGSGNIEKYQNERLIISGDSSAYAGNITAYAGVLQSLTSVPTDKPFGSANTITINPGAHIVLSAPSNINANQVTINSDHGGISTIGQLYVGDPAAIPSMTINSTANFKVSLGIGAVGYSQNINQSTLFGGNTYLGAALGYTGIYTGTLTPAASGYLLGGSQGTLRVASPLTGSSNAIIGISMTGTGSRADQTVNNGGATVQFDTAMTYSGNTILNPGPLLRLSANNALTGTGDVIFAGGQLRADPASGQNRMIAPIVLTNDIIMTADSTIQMENSAYDFRIGGNIALAPGSTGVVRALSIGSDQPGAAANLAGMVYLDGGISDGTGGSGNHFLKNGVGTLFFTGTNTYTGTTTIQQGLIGINGDADWGSTTGNINAPGGGIAVWENSFTTSKNYSAHGGNFHVDVLGGLTLTQSASSVVDGTSSLVKRGLGTMILNGENAVTAFIAADGVLQFNSLLSTANSASTNNFSIGGDVTLGGANNATRYTGGTMRFNFTGTTTRGFVFNNNTNTNFGGGIDVTAGNTLTAGGVISQGTELDYAFKTGPGTLITTAANTWRGLAVTNGVLQFGNSTPWANSTATAADNTFIEMMGGSIRAFNTGANIDLTNQASTTTYNYGGGMTLSMGSGTGFSVQIAADNLIRQNQGTLVIRTEGSTVLGGAGNTNAARVIVTNAVNASVARASALNNGIFPAHLVGATAAGDGFFLQDNVTTGFEAYSGATNPSLSGLAPNAIGNISSPQTLTGTNSIYAFRTTADVSGGILNVTAIDNIKSGGILFNGSNTISSGLVFDPTSATAPGTGSPGEGLVFVKSGENAVISGNVTANLLTKFGNGTLTLSGNNAILGDVSVQAGTLRLGGSSVLSSMNSELNINSGAILDLNGFSTVVESIGSNNRTVAGANLGGTITNSSGTLSTLMMASPVSSVFNGTMSLNTKLVKSGTGNLVINGYSASSPEAGNNTYTGGTEIYGSNSSLAGGSTTNASTTVTVTSTAGLLPGMAIQGANIPTGSTIVSITSGTQFVISNAATASATGQTYTAQGGLTVNNAAFGLGGYNGSTAGPVNLYSGTLNLLFSNGNTGINGTQGQQFNNQVVKIGAESGDGVTLNVNGPGVVNVGQGIVNSAHGQWGQGNIIQVGAMNLSNTTLQLSGNNLYRFRAAGPISILGSQAAFQTLTAGTSGGALELTGKISGSGALTKLGDGTLFGIVISNPNNDYSGGTNIVAGDVQVTATTGTALGTGPVRVFPDGTLRLAGNGSVNGANLTTMSRSTALGAVMLDDNFDPTVLNSTNFRSWYNTSLQLGQPFFTQALDLATIGDGRAYLGAGINAEVAYTAATLGAGVADSWNPTVGVYRIAPATSSFAFSGADNVLTGSNFLQVGVQRNNILGTVTNGGNILVIRNSNNYTEGTQIAKGASIYIETGGRASGETPMGSGAVEVYGELRVRGSQGSLWNANTSAMTNAINLRPGGVVRLHEGEGTNTTQFLGAGNQGRWGDAIGLDLNGGSFILNGASNWASSETMGAITARKAGQLQVFRNSGSSAATLNVSDISRAERGVLMLQYNSGFLGINTTTPLSYERIVTGTIGGAAISRGGTTTNGSGVVNGGIVAPWIIDRTTNSFVGYDPTVVGGTGFQPLVSAAPGAGQLAYNQILSGATLSGLGVNDIVDVTNATKTFSANQTAYALRTSQNINPTTGGLSLTLGSGGLIMTGGTINATGAITAGVVSPMTLNFGSGGAGEAFIYNSGTAIIQAQIVAAQGLTKFGAGQLQIHGINPGIGGDVVLHEGTTYIRVPYSGTGSPVGQVLNSQDIIVNGGTLNIQSIMANAGGTASEIASTPTSAQSLLESDIFIRGDAAMRNNGATQYVRIADLTIGNSAGSVAMTGNSSITLNLQSGIWVRGTTTLAQEAVINSTFDGFAQSTFAGQVTGQDFVKHGNGTVTFLNGSNNYTGGTTIWGSTLNTATSTVASAFRGAGTPFSTGDIQIQPGGHLRIADNANIASNAVYLRSDGYGLGGIGIAHNGVLPTFITSGTPTAGQIRVDSTGPFNGVLSLDYGYYSRELTPATIAGGNWWIGNSQQAEAYYFNDSIGASTNGRYLLGGGGNQSGVNFGSVSVGSANTRTPLFENVFSGGTADSVRVEIGAQTGDFAWNSPAFVNGNIGFITLPTRNTGLTGDVRVNTGSTLAIGNNFALGSGRLVVNGGSVRVDLGTNNFATSQIVIDNNVVLQGDFNTTVAGNEFVINGNVAMSDVVGAGATRIWNLNGTSAMAVGLTAGSTTNGVISGAAGSNLIKRGTQLVSLRGANTYQGFTQIDRGDVVVVGNVAPGVAGPLGSSISPIVLGVESANNAGSLGIGGRYTVSRDIQVVGASGTGINLIRGMTLQPATVSGGISVATNGVLTLGSVGTNHAIGTGGRLDITGPISGGGAVRLGTTTAVTSFGGTVGLLGNVNGYGINTYSGGTTLNSARVEIGADTYYTGPATNPVILAGPFGTGALTLTSGEGGNGAVLVAVGGARTIVNAFAATSSDSNATFKFMGNQALTFTRNWDLHSGGTLRNRVFQTTNYYQPTTFSGNLSNSGVQGSNLLKTGNGILVLSGTNTQANLITSDANYGTGVFIDAGILRVGADASLGSTATLAAGGQHSSGPADIRMRGGALSVSSGFATSRQIIFATTATSGTTNNVNTGIDVASGQTLTLNTAMVRQTGTIAVSTVSLTKSGPGTLALNSNANLHTTLILGGVAQANPNIGVFGHTGGTVSTTATSGTPFGTGTITINSGTLSLIGGGTAQALSIPNLNYGASAAIALNQGSTSSQLTVSTALARTGTFNSVNYGTLTINPSALGNLGGTEKVIVSAGAPANTTLGGGNTLTVPSVFVAQAGAGQDANFARYDATNGFTVHTADQSTTLAANAPATIANITAADTVGAAANDVINVYGLRTNSNIAGFDSSVLLRINGGGMILNGATAPVISSNVLFGTGTGSGLKEAIVYVRDGQTGASQLSGSVSALDFTKTGGGILELSGAGNVLNTNATRLPVLSVQNGTFRFANVGAQFSNANRSAGINTLTGSYVLNVNESGIFDLNGLNTQVGGLAGNGTVTSGVAGAATLKASNGFGVDTVFSGSITDGSGSVGLTKTGNGTLQLSGYNTYTGGTNVQAGRVTNATGATAGLGTLDARSLTALGNGAINLQGGILAINANVLESETRDNLNYNMFGGANGANITIAASGFSNGAALPANTSSTLSLNSTNTVPATGVSNVGINTLTVNAPMLSLVGPGTGANRATMYVQGATTFSSANTILRTTGRAFLTLGGRIDAEDNTITKIGFNGDAGTAELVITNGASGLGQNSVGLWKIYGGLVQARTANGSSNPLGSNPIVELNGGSTNYGLQLVTDGDGTASSERVTTYADTTLRFGSALPVSSNEFVSSGSSRIQTDRILGTNDDKTIVVNNQEIRGALGSAFSYYNTPNLTSLWVNGTTNFQRDWTFQADGNAVTFNGVISGNGSLNRKANGANVFYNAVNTYDGGTFFTGSGRNLLGSFEGNRVNLSNTAKLGLGHVYLGPLATFQVNAAGNLREGQNIYVNGNLSFTSVFSLAADLPLEQVRLMSHGLGGIQDSATDYYLKAVNPSSSVLALGTVYNQEIDMMALGDGMWFLGSATNMVGAHGSYEAAVLKPGLANTYRLGAGGATLFLGANGNENILTDVNASNPSSLIVGDISTVQNVGPRTSGTLVLMGDQNYTGSTRVNFGSQLDVRGSLTTSGITVNGTLNISGESGTLINPNTNSNIPVTLRPGSTLRFDNTSAGVLPTTATEGRWKDATPLSLNNSVLRLQGNAAVEVVETMGAITAGAGGNRIEVVRGVTGRGVELRTPSLTRANNGTVQFIHNGSALGSDERVIITGTAPTVTNGMVDPWMFSASDNQFLTYNADTGFTIAGFDRVQGAATLTTSTGTNTERLFVNGAVVLNGGDLLSQALRIDTDVTLTTASAATDSVNRLIINGTNGMSGLLANAARTVQTGIWAGATGANELIIYNNNTFNVGIAANNTTSGRIRAGSITKTGSGTFQILSEQPDFTGDIRIQQGALQLGYTATIATNITTNLAGNGGSIIFQGNNTTLNTRIGNDSWTVGTTATFNKNIVIGDDVTLATISLDRNGGNISGRTMIFNDLTFGSSIGDVGQILRVTNPTNDAFHLQFNGTTTLNGRSSFSVDNNYSGSTNNLVLAGKVTGNGMLIKGPADSKTRTMILANLASLNDFTQGTTLQGGTLQVFSRAANSALNGTGNLIAGGLGAGDVTLMQGTLDIRADADSGTVSGGTFTQAGTTITVTLTGHGLPNGATILLPAVAGNPAGYYTVANTAANTFTLTSTVSQTVGTATALTWQGSDNQLERILFNGTGNGPNLIVGGSSVVNVDRNAYVGTWTRASNVVTATVPSGHIFAVGQSITIPTGGGPNAGTFVVTGVSGNTLTYTDATGTTASGAFTATQVAGSNKMIVYNNLTMGSQWLTVTGGSGFGLEINGTTTLHGSPYINNSTELVLNGAISTDGGGAVIFNKTNTSNLWINSANPTLAANVYVNAGLLAFGNRLTGSTTANLGTGDIFVNAGAQIQIRGTGNINTGLGQQVVLTGTQYAPAIARTAFNVTQANLTSMIQATTPGVNQVAMVALEATQSNPLDLSGIANGRLYLGANGDRSYTAASILPGLGNLPNSVIGGTSTNPVYRFTHMSSNTLTINLSTGGIGNATGNVTTDVQIGSQAILGPNGNLGSTGFVYFQDQNTYTGQTVVARSTTLRFNVGMATGNTAGPLGANAGAAIDVYGGLRIEPGGSLFQNGSTTTHFYTNLNLKPVSLLSFQDMSATGVNSNRWGDSVGINLDGSSVTFDALNNTDNAAETVGAITFDRGSRVNLTSEGTGDAFATAASMGRAAAGTGAGQGRGTMVFVPSNTAQFGVAATAGAAQQQMKFTTAPTTSATSAVTGMLPGFYMDGNGHRFVKIGANGVIPVADGEMVAMPTGAGVGTEVVNITANTNMGGFETSIFALRGGAFTLNSPTGANNEATITLAGSGADIGNVASFGAFVINPNLKFGSTGTNEALFYTGSTLTVNGNITAGSITKFGTGGTLVISNDQSDAARGTGNGYQGGWVVNEGNLQFGQFGSAGNAHANNTIVLNGSNAGSAQLNLRAQPADTLLNYTYTSGKIYAVDFATIDWDPGADDRVHTIADIEIQQSGGHGAGPINGTLDAYLRIANNRNRSILSSGTLTVASNAILNVDTTAAAANFAAASTNGAYLTNSLSSGMSVASLSGSNRLTKWGDGTLYVRGNSAGFSGPMIIDQGSVFVTHNGSLGTGALTVNRYGVLEIGVADFAPTNSSVTFTEGSMERWSVDGARSGTVDLGKATLQIAANQPTADVDVTLNGGGIQAFVRGDDHSAAQASGGVLRVLNPNVTFAVSGTNFLGDRYYEGANGLDSGKQENNFRPMEEYTTSGAILEIKGVISGTGSMTKVGYDTVILSGANTYSGGTTITGGKLAIGRDDALLTTGSVITTANGVLDLNGQNQTIGSLGNLVATTGTSTTQGYITNSSTTNKVLSVGNGVTTDFSYGGVIQHNVSLTKIGAAVMSLTNNNTYIGTTTVDAGILQVTTGRLSGTRQVLLNTGGTLRLNSSSNNVVNGLANMELDGGSLVIDNSKSGNTQNFNALTVSSNSTIDFGTGNTNIFRFSGLDSITGILSVRGWTGTPYAAGTVNDNAGDLTQDRLQFTSSPGTPGTAVNGMIFYNDSGVSVGRGMVVNDSGIYGVVAANMTTAYWKGGLATKAWNLGNWSTDLAGTIVPGLAPTGATDVIISATGQSGQDVMLLGEDMEVKSVTVNSENAGTPVVLQSTGGYGLTIISAAAITTDSGAPAATFQTPVTFSATSATVAVNSSNALTLSGVVSGVNVEKTGNGTLILSGANSYSGTTTVTAGVLQLGSGGTSGSLNPASAIVNNSVLSFNRSDVITQGTDFNSVIGGTGEVRQAGSGTTVLTGTNTYSGPTSITAGKLSISSESNLGSNPGSSSAAHLLIDGGILETTATFEIDDVNRGITIGSADGTIETASGTSLTISNPVTLTGDLTKSGDGALYFDSSSTGSGQVIVAAGTLGGIGTVSGDTTISSGAVITGGTVGTVGTLTFSGDLTLESGSTWLVDLVETNPNDADKIAVSGLLELGGSFLDLNAVGTYSANNYVIATFGNLNGTFDGLDEGDVIGNYFISYGVSTANAITLTAVPEPGTLSLLGIALSGLLARRLRRKRQSEVNGEE